MEEMYIEVAGKKFPIGEIQCVDAFFATISYRLEPDGWGSRFPITMDHLSEGRVGSGNAREALNELRIIEPELRALPKDKVIWDIQERSPRDDAFQPVNHSAANVYDYFITRSGKPILSALKEAIETSLRTGQSATVEGGLQILSYMKGGVTIAVGLLWALLVYLLFPNFVLRPRYSGGNPGEGLRLWPVGLLIALIGAGIMLATKFPALLVWCRRKAPVAIVLGIGLLIGFMALAWHRPPKPPLYKLPVFRPVTLPSINFTPYRLSTRPAMTGPATRPAER